MNETLRAFTAWLGFPGLTFDLDQPSRRRIIWVSALPALIVVAVLTQIALILVFDDFDPYPGFAPEFWRRIWLLSQAVATATPVAVAILIGAGVRPWRRSEGSWMLLIGLALAFVAFGLVTASAWIYAVFDFSDAVTLRADIWLLYSWEPGFLAIGYFFLAFRSLGGGRRSASPRPRRYRPSEEPPSPSP
jgi:hypothetical protein